MTSKSADSVPPQLVRDNATLRPLYQRWKTAEAATDATSQPATMANTHGGSSPAARRQRRQVCAGLCDTSSSEDGEVSAFRRWRYHSSKSADRAAHTQVLCNASTHRTRPISDHMALCSSETRPCSRRHSCSRRCRPQVHLHVALRAHSGSPSSRHSGSCDLESLSRAHRCTTARVHHDGARSPRPRMRDQAAASAGAESFNADLTSDGRATSPCCLARAMEQHLGHQHEHSARTSARGSPGAQLRQQV